VFLRENAHACACCRVSIRAIVKRARRVGARNYPRVSVINYNSPPSDLSARDFPFFFFFPFPAKLYRDAIRVRVARESRSALSFSLSLSLSLCFKCRVNIPEFKDLFYLRAIWNRQREGEKRSDGNANLREIDKFGDTFEKEATPMLRRAPLRADVTVKKFIRQKVILH